VQLLRYYTDLINKTDLSFSLKDLPDVQEEVLKRHDEVQQNPGISGIPFGFPALDEITYGSQKGDFNVIVGVTGACKSYMSLKSALTAYYAGNNVIFISPEMPEEQIARRLLGIQTQLRDSDIRKGKLSYYAIEKAKQIIRTPISIEGKVQDNYFKILPSGLYSDVNSIISVCSEYKPDFLCIDGFYLLKNSAIRTNSAWREDESVIFALKNFSIHSQIPILATTQYNRAKPGKIEGARGTQSTEQISSNFLSLEFENPEDRDTMRPIQTRLLKIKKSRDGDSAIIRVKLNFNKMTIEEDTIIRGDEGFEPEFEDDQFIGDL
jgi:replicative DNA helicase